MYKFINEQGQTLTFKTIKAFAIQYGLHESHARGLACGSLAKLNGWCSTHPRAKKTRKRFLTVLVNPRQNKREILGRSITRFAREHGLSENSLWKVLNGYRLACNGWMLEQTHKLAQGSLVDDFL